MQTEKEGNTDNSVTDEEMDRGFPGQSMAENCKCSVAAEKWKGASEKGAEELPRNVRSSQPSLDSFICVAWMLLV